MDPENPSENLPEEPPKGLTDKYKRKLRRLLEVVSKQPKSVVSTLKTQLKSASRAILNTIKRWINTVKVKSRRLSEAPSKRSKSAFSGLKPALKSVLDSIKGWARKLSGVKNSLSKWLDVKKDKLRKIKRGLIIWVISVAIVSMVAAITNYIMNEQQVASQRIFQLERQLEATTEEKKEAENKLKEMAYLRERLTNLFEEKQLRAAIKEKRVIENKLKDTVSQLEKTARQLEHLDRLEDHLAYNLKEITRLRENLGQLEQERASEELLVRLAYTWLEPEAQMQETKAVIETKRLVENKLKDTADQLEKTVRQLEGMDQLKEQFANSLEEITRLKKDLAEQLESQRSINELLGSWKPEGERPETKKAEELVPVKAAEDIRKVDPALEIPQRPGFFKKPTVIIVFAIAIVVGVTGLCLSGSRVQWLRKLVKKRLPEEKLHKFKHLEDVSFTLLGGLLLKGFVKMGYEVTLSSGITSGRLTCVLERENEKALFRYIICKEDDDFHQAFVEDFAKSMKEEKADRGYLVTTGSVAEPVLALAKEKSIELAGKEKLVELIPSCLFEKSMMREWEDAKVELVELFAILKDEMAEKQTLSEKLKENQDMIIELNDEKTALSKEVKTKEEEYSQLLKEHKDIQKELQMHKEEVSSLVSERNSLQGEIGRLRGKAQSIDEQLTKYKDLEEQLSDKDKLLEDERSQRQQLEDKLRQSDKDLEEAMYLTDDMEEKLAKKDCELSEKETALSKLQEEVQNYVTEMEDEIFPSLDLTSLADKGVLLKLEPEGPVVTLKNIGTSGASFESQRKLDIPSSCNITLIFFGSSNPLTIRGGLIWQKKLPSSSMYNIRFKFLSVKPSQSRRINEYINKA